MGPCERLVLAFPAQCLLALILPALYLPAGAAVFIAALAGACLWGAVLHTFHGHGARVSILTLLACLLSLATMWRLDTVPVSPWPFQPEGELEGVGTVLGDANRTRAGSLSFQFQLETVAKGPWQGAVTDKVTVRGYSGQPPAAGSRWSWSGRLGGSQALYWSSAHQTGWEAPWWQWRANIRDRIFSILSPLGPENAALSQALLLGATDDLTPYEKDSFRWAGCSHVLALSGMHLGLLAWLLLRLGRRRIPGSVLLISVQSVLGAFCFLAGPLPSLMRAWAMSGLAGLWQWKGYEVPPQELLAQSFIASLILWPDLTRTLSFELSFLAMLGLFWWSRPWDDALRPFLGRWAAGQLGSSAAALAATAPLTTVLFGDLHWVGLILTPPLVALTTLYLGLSAFAVGLGFSLPEGSVEFLVPAFTFLYEGTFATTAWGARFPAAPALVVLVVLAMGALAGGAVFLYNRWYRRARLPVSLNYDSPAALQAFLDDKGFNALKRWGQNFLINAGARRQILAALELKPGEPVWEVGPGLGALTHHLVSSGHPLTVFEIDPGYADFLRAEFGDAAAGFRLVEGDVVKTWKTQSPSGCKTVGNLPYNAASAIIADFVEGGFFPQVFVVTVQLEMAQRMTATPGNKNYSSFSVLCQSAFRLDDVVTLKPGSFYPSPEVTSRVVRLRPHGLYPGLNHGKFSTFVRECFSSRRKTLRNNLPHAASSLHVSDEALTAAFQDARIDLGLRAEALKVSDFVKVFSSLSLPSA